MGIECLMPRANLRGEGSAIGWVFGMGKWSGLPATLLFLRLEKRGLSEAEWMLRCHEEPAKSDENDVGTDVWGISREICSKQ
jgi:hypothetical protein